MIAASALLLAAVLSFFLLRFAVIDGDSMEGTLDSGDLVAVSLNAYRGGAPERNDVILFKRSDLTKGRIVKRVVAVGGDEIEIRGGTLYVNGVSCGDDIYRFDESESYVKTTVPDGCCFVIGDNFAESNDSRHWDDPFVKYGDIDGRVLFRLFPSIDSID